MTAKQAIALEQVIAYSWNDEMNDYEEQDPEDREGHVFEHLVTLDNMLRGVNLSTRDYLKPAAFVPLVSCAKRGRSVATSAAVMDAGTGPEEGSTFTYCSQACMEAH